MLMMMLMMMMDPGEDRVHEAQERAGRAPISVGKAAAVEQGRAGVAAVGSD